MTPTYIVANDLKLPCTRVDLFLSLLIREITLRARGVYTAGAESADAERLRTFNELQNRVAAHLVQHLTGQCGYPDRVFLQMLRETAEHGRCADDLRIAFEEAARALDTATSDV